MEILALGLNHKTSPIELREALYFDDAAMAAFLRQYMLERPNDGIVGLSTCNRSEFYLATRDPQKSKDRLLGALETAAGRALRRETGCFYVHAGAEAIAHLCRVATGIDSLVMGEDQILGQVRRAYDLASSVGSASSPLALLFSQVFRIAKKARTETRISEGSISVASVAVGFIQQIFADLSQQSVLLLGAGETGQTVARCLIDAGVNRLTVTNRTLEKARELAGELGGVALDFEKMEKALVDADIVVCATGSPEALLTAAMLQRVMNLRGNRLLAAVDISVPRNIEPEADDIGQVFVYDMKALEQVCEENRARRAVEAREAERIIAAEVERYMERATSLDSDAVIRALRRRIDGIRQAEIDRYGKSFHSHEMENLDKFSQGLINKILHDLTLNIKEMGRESDEGLLEFDVLCRALNLNPSESDKEESDG
jgi:glutamyl-tRNA reductase